jgi:hypothetical protein
VIGKRNGWLILALAVIALKVAVIGAWLWLRRREVAGTEDLPPPQATVAVPVVVAARTSPTVVPVSAHEPTPPVAAVRSGPRSLGPSDVDAAHPFGPASATPDPQGAGPSGWTIKAKDGSRLYHTPSSPSWARMHADAWFESEDAAEAAGFRRWDWRRNAT